MTQPASTNYGECQRTRQYVIEMVTFPNGDEITHSCIMEAFSAKDAYEQARIEHHDKAVRSVRPWIG